MTIRPFSLRLYLFIVFLFSWPFQIAYLYLGPEFRSLLLLSMIMVSAATFVCGKYIFRDGFSTVGFRWGSPKYYLYAFALPLFLWLVPSVLERIIGLYRTDGTISIFSLSLTFLLSFVITLLPAFGEEFGWRGYMLPRLLKRYSIRKALLLHGFVTWVWHLPFLVAQVSIYENNFVLLLGIFIISLLPTVMHALVFAYFRSASGSIVVATVYHAAFDEVRDTLSESVGFGPFVELWQMTTLTILGAVLLRRTGWIKKKTINGSLISQ